MPQHCMDRQRLRRPAVESGFMDSRNAAERFLDSPALAESTRRAYRVDVEEFLDWLEAREAALDDIDVRTLVDYASELGAGRRVRGKLAPATI